MSASFGLSLTIKAGQRAARGSGGGIVRVAIPRKHFWEGFSIPAAGTSSVRSLRCSVESRHLWIGVEDRAESCFQWAEPGIVVAPVFERVAVKRLLHLLGTRRGQNTLRFVKCKARLFERHADE